MPMSVSRFCKRLYIWPLSVLLATVFSSVSAAAAIDADLLSGLTARSVGPASMSGRVAAIDVVQSNPKIMYVATASGGVWKSVNAGLNWTPVFDREDYASIGAVAVYQANPEIVWVGTGEGNVRNSTSIGGGIYKSVDGGQSWQKMGLPNSERINRIALDPDNPDVAFVAAMGTLWGPNTERGVFKTTDGGKTWRNVLYVNDATGATDIKMNPSNPRHLIAAMWQFRRWPYQFESGGPGSGLYVSHDGGETWAEKTEEDGLPAGDKGRMVVAFARSEANTVYTLVEAGKSALLRSDDGGNSWQTVNNETNITDRPFYYTEIAVDPKDANTVYNIATRVSKSIDGGKTFSAIAAINCCSAPNAVHIDVHAMWINNQDSRHMIVGNDGGLAISRDGGDTWRYVSNLPLAQFYHVAVDNDHPYNIYGGLQDNGSFRGPAEVWENGGIRNFHWQEVAFGDGFDTVPDPDNSRQGYAMSQGGALVRWNLDTAEQFGIRPQPPAKGVELRFNWNAGFAQDPFDAATIYYGSQFVHKSTDRGRTWQAISGDLTTNNPDWQKYKESGGITKDVTAAENYTTIVAIAPSPVDNKVIWVGTDDGRVHVTRDGGASWQSIEDGARGVSKNAWVPHIEASPHDAGVAFVVFDDHRRSDMAPYVYRADNYGKRWKGLANKSVQGYALTIQQDHEDPDLLFLGTELGLYISTDGGEDWFKFTAGLPTVSVMDLAIQQRENDLVIGTHGRGIYVIDDYSALRGLNKGNFSARLKLLSVTDGQQYVEQQSPSSRFDASGGYRADNEPYGVALTFVMSGDDLQHPDKEQERNRKINKRLAGSKPKDDEADATPEDTKITVTINDSNGRLVRTFKAPVTQGVNRVIWDLRSDGARPVVDPANPAPQEDPDILPPGPEVVPGQYRVSMSYNGATANGTANVLTDPRSTASNADRQAGYNLSRRLVLLEDTANQAISSLLAAASDINAIIALANKAAKQSGEKGESDLKALIEDGNKLKKVVESEQARFRVPPNTKGRVYGGDKITALIGEPYGYFGNGFAPYSQAVHTYLERGEKALAEGIQAVNALFENDIARFRNRAQQLGVVLLGKPEPLVLP